MCKTLNLFESHDVVKKYNELARSRPVARAVVFTLTAKIADK